MISEVCNDLQVKYVSWVYDCPLHIRNKEPMKYSCNTIFFFDRIEAENYRNKGVNAYHLPLAGDTVAFTEKYKYVDMNMMHNEEKGIYTGSTENDMCDVSLVGKLYHSDYAYLLRPLDQYCRGYLEGVVEAQRNVYGGCFIGDCLSDSFIERINASYLAVTNGEFKILREELEYAVGTEITDVSVIWHLLFYRTDVMSVFFRRIKMNVCKKLFSLVTSIIIRRCRRFLKKAGLILIFH